MEKKPECCAQVVVAYENGKIICGSCGKDLPKILEPSQITRITAGYSRNINWDRHLWGFPIKMDASVSCKTWAEVRQTYLELFDEARKEINNAVRLTRHEFADPSQRPEAF